MTPQDLAQQLRERATQARFAALESAYQARENDYRMGDVTGYWLVFADDGRGQALYRGRVYTGEVLALSSIPRGTAINLRRTPAGAFLDW